MRSFDTADTWLEANFAAVGHAPRRRVGVPRESASAPNVDVRHLPPADLMRTGCRVGALRAAPALLSALDVDPDPVLRSAGLAPETLTEPENRIDYTAVGRLLRDGANASGLQHFGLMIGRTSTIEGLGILGDIMRNCGTLREALQMLVLHQNESSGGNLTFMLTRAAVVDLGHAVYVPGLAGVDQILDAAIAATFNYVRELAGPAWEPTEMFLARAKPATTLVYHQTFGVKPRFNAEFCAMRFPAYWLDRRIDGASAARKAEALAFAPARTPGIVMQAYCGLRMLLLCGTCSGDDLARMLLVHRRTLNRRLKDAGTTFQAVLDDVRHEVARQLLTYTDVALDDVAASSGYASVSSFMRAFRRWAGITPSRFRRNQQQLEHGSPVFHNTHVRDVAREAGLVVC